MDSARSAVPGRGPVAPQRGGPPRDSLPRGGGRGPPGKGGPLEVLPSREGAIFRVKAQPGAPRTAFKGEHGGALKVAVAAAPERGKANEALISFLARALGLDRRALEITAGEGARDKRILARGVDAGALAARLAALLSGAGKA